MALFDRIQNLCSENNISQSELEKTLSFGKGTISKWSGSTIPASDKLKKIADYFNVSMDYLMTGENDKRKNGYDEIDEYLDLLHKDKRYRVLLDSSKKLDKESLDQLIAFIDSLQK